MEILKKRLSETSGGRILDIATGMGYFADLLSESFKDYSEIIGIDNFGEEKLQKAREGLEGKDIKIISMDAEKLEFEDESFDTVSISNSLHHLKNFDKVLGEMKRVLKPGGLFIISEMYSDNQTESQLSHVYMHHWWGEIDTQNGIYHNETYKRAEILQIIEGQSLKSKEVFDFVDDDDPMDQESIEHMKKSIDTYIKRAENLPEFDKLRETGEVLRARLDKVGVSGATQLIIIGTK